jgi:hypothetical protein
MRRGRPPSWASSVKDAPEHPDDAREGFWPRAQLVKMNARFVARLEHAVATGRERVTIAPHARARSPYLVGGLAAVLTSGLPLILTNVRLPFAAPGASSRPPRSAAWSA